METGDFTAGPFITFTKEPVIENGLLKATISFDRLFDTTDLSQRRPYNICLLYTSDAADDLLCVDLGGRRILKKKKQNKNNKQHKE